MQFYFSFAEKLDTWIDKPPKLIFFVNYQSMTFFFLGMTAFRLFSLRLSQAVLVGMLHNLSGLKGGTVVVVDMILNHLKKAFVYFSLIFGDISVIYANKSHSFMYHETGKQDDGS